MATSNKKIALHLTDIPDHLLAEIFLRVPTPEDLARASAACVPFRRLVTDRSFLRRFRRLHEPPLLGFLECDGFHPALPPQPSAPAARALALAADFSFSFLPSHCRWTVQDCRDGRVLLSREHQKGEEPPVFRELAVCDPLHRRYVLLPPVPDDLARLVEPWSRCKPFLVPLGEEDTVEETAFKVIWMAHCLTKLSAFVFSSRTGIWQAAASKSWSDLALNCRDLSMMQLHYAYGCFYFNWTLLRWRKKLLVLDTCMMEFSIADLPPGQWTTGAIAIVEAGEGKLGMFGYDGETESLLSYSIAQNKGKSPSQWQMERTISLDSGYEHFIEAATERHLLLTRKAASSAAVEYFSMDAKTLQLQRICAKRLPLIYGTHIYSNFPPSLLSSRAI